jgi:cytochrome bd ubiquinol oxidase subunit II
MDLNTIWFILIAVLYIGFFVLEGFDFGVGILLPFLGKNDTQRRAIINTIGPFWDGNEVWLLTAGGATFAAFPHWYATMFSGFYLPLFLLLMALILRGVAFEFRSKDDDPRWRKGWDSAIFIGSLLPALLLGVAFTNLARGVPIDANMLYAGGFFNLLNPYALLGGLSAVLAFTLHGAIFLSLKTTGDLLEKSRQAAARLWLPTVLVLVLFVIFTYFQTDILTKLGVNPGPVPLVSAIAILAAAWFIKNQTRRLGLCDDGYRDSCFHNNPVSNTVPQSNDFQSQSRLEPDHLQCLIWPLYFAGHDHCGGDLFTRGAGIPGLELLGVSKAN